MFRKQKRYIVEENWEHGKETGIESWWDEEGQLIYSEQGRGRKQLCIPQREHHPFCWPGIDRPRLSGPFVGCFEIQDDGWRDRAAIRRLMLTHGFQ